mgnify:CR=1 FL=1
MKIPLSKEEISELNDALSYHDRMFHKFIRNLLPFILVFVIIMYVSTGNIYIALLNFIFVCGIAYWIADSLNRVKIRQLNIDIKKGYKKCDITVIKRRMGNVIYLKNGMKIFESELEFFDLKYKKVKNKMLKIEYTPYNRYILTIDIAPKK